MKIDFWFEKETGLWCASFPFSTLDGQLHLVTAGDESPDDCLRKLADCVEEKLYGELLQQQPREGRPS